MTEATFSLHIQGPMSALRALIAGHVDVPQQDEDAAERDRRDLILSLEKERDEALAKLAASVERLRVVTAAKAEIAESYAGVCDENRVAQQEIYRLKAMLDDRSANVDSLKGIVETLRGEVKAYEDVCSAADTEIATLKKRIAELEEKFNRKAKEVTAIDTLTPSAAAPASPAPIAPALHAQPHDKPAEPVFDAPKAAEPEPKLKANLQTPALELMREIKFGGVRQKHAEFIATSTPTLEEFMARFECERQPALNKISSLRMACSTRAVVVLRDDKRYEIKPVLKPSPASPPAPAPVDTLQVGSAHSEATLAEPAINCLVRVSLPLLTARSRKGSGRVASSLFGKVLIHMADGQMYGIGKLKTVGGYATEDALRLAFASHKTMLARLGLEIYADKINARLVEVAQ